MTKFHPAPFNHFSLELKDPWPVVERLRLALVEAQYYTPGAENTIASNLIHRVYYSNDDGGMVVGNDSYLLFNPPADGEYLVNVRETTSY